MLKVGDRVLVIGPETSSIGLCGTIISIDSSGPWRYTVNLEKVAMLPERHLDAEELVTIPKKATEQQIKALKKILCSK